MSDGNSQPAVLPVVTWASNIKMKRLRFLWNGIIPAGTITVFAGRGAAGKGTICAWLAGQVAAGKLPGAEYSKPANVLMVTGNEDAYDSVIVPRLKAADVDLRRVGLLKVQDSRGVSMLSFPRDVGLLEAEIRRTSAKLVIIDPVSSVFAGNLDRREDVRMGIDPLAGVAERTGAALLIVHHFAKGGGNARDKLTGSVAWDDAARSLLTISVDPQNENERIISQQKNTHTKLVNSFKFTISGREIKFDDASVQEYPRADFGGDSCRSVQDAINDTYQGATGGEDDDDLAEWLTQFFTDGPCHPQDVFKTANAVGGWSKDQVKRAKRKIGIEARKVSQHEWLWLTPAQAAEVDRERYENTLLEQIEQVPVHTCTLENNCGLTCGFQVCSNENPSVQTEAAAHLQNDAAANLFHNPLTELDGWGATTETETETETDRLEVAEAGAQP